MDQLFAKCVVPFLSPSVSNHLWTDGFLTLGRSTAHMMAFPMTIYNHCVYLFHNL